MTTHTPTGRRPSPRPRAGEDTVPGSVAAPGVVATDAWSDWSWPDAAWSGAAWSGGEDDPGALDDADPHDADPHDADPHDAFDHGDPGRTGWLPLLDDSVIDGPGTDRSGPDLDRRADPDPAATPVGAPRRGRRAVGVLGALCAVAMGFLGGVVADRLVVAEAAAGPTRLAGEVASDGGGTLAVRAPDGRLVAVHTSAGTRTVTANPVTGDLPAGTMVDVWTRRSADGALEATAVVVRPGAVSGP